MSMYVAHRGERRDVHTKICPRTDPKQARPRPRNHILKVKAGRLGSSSREIRRVATSRSVSGEVFSGMHSTDKFGANQSDALCHPLPCQFLVYHHRHLP
jgi:hypothetical protein